MGRARGLSAAEFITVMVLLLAGSGMRLYQFNKEHDAGKLRESGVALISKAMDTVASLATRDSSKHPILFSQTFRAGAYSSCKAR